MEIFLLVVILVLLIAFHAIKNTKLKKTEDRLTNIENYLKAVKFSQAQKTTTQTTVKTEETIEETEKIVPPVTTTITPPKIVEEPIIIKTDEIPPPVKEVEKIIADKKKSQLLYRLIKRLNNPQNPLNQAKAGTLNSERIILILRNLLERTLLAKLVLPF